MIAVGTFMSPEGDIPVVINQIVQLNCTNNISDITLWELYSGVHRTAQMAASIWN